MQLGRVDSVHQGQGDYVYVLGDGWLSAQLHTLSEATNQQYHPLDEQAFWRILQPLVVQVHCGHTRVQHSAAYRAWARQQPNYYFPFTVAVRQDHLFVAECCTRVCPQCTCTTRGWRMRQNACSSSGWVS